MIPPWAPLARNAGGYCNAIELAAPSIIRFQANGSCRFAQQQSDREEQEQGANIPTMSSSPGINDIAGPQSCTMVRSSAAGYLGANDRETLRAA
jgi:hypothetical protein